ncbi:MAG: UDP-3-O-acyl-N-acetylglucosamine deacetylase [Acidobacteria bacterium]|nr:UDP-3-O-acyl-N-acetylglucosamine deacetylase [Acidobacteriota bacterium]
MTSQRTLRRSITCAGIGLHSGHRVTMTLRPAPADYGIRFRRADLGGLEIPARLEHVASLNYATGLSFAGASVETVEHLLAALVSQGLDNVAIELNTPEVPIMDGSAAPFVYLLQEAGIKKLSASRRFLKVLRPVSLARGDKHIAIYPSDEFRISYTISFDHPLLRNQSRSIVVTADTFAEDLAPARTFGFLKDLEMLRQQGLTLGGSLDNAVVLGETGVLNNTLRFEDEFVRHKILDAIGDLALIGAPIIGHVVAHRGGHALHTALGSTLLEQRDAWTYVETPESVTDLVGMPIAVEPAFRN